jgi:asparagine synthetase B (glutamine-hydrolysing)
LIGGYVLPSRDLRFEDACRKKSPIRLSEFVLEGGGYVAWFFHTADNQHAHNNVYSDEANLLVIDGLAVTQDSNAEYRLFDPSIDFSPTIQTAFVKCIDRIVSGVTAILVSVHQEGVEVNFASGRVSPGRIWYAQPSDKRGIVLCDDFRVLMEFSQPEIEPKAIYGIVKYGISPDPLTIIRNISSVPVSHFGTFNSQKLMVEVQPYFRFDFPQIHDCNLDFAKGLLRNSLEFLRSVNPMILLSGGVDSTLLAHYLGQGDKTNAFFLSHGTNDPRLAWAEVAARETGANLDIVYMGEKDVIPLIQKMPSSYMHPFTDYSTIATYHLMNHIKQAHPGGGVLIDGTGADSCFGLPLYQQEYRYSWAHCQPKFAKQVYATIYDNLRMYKRNSRVFRLLELMATSDTDIQLYPLMFCRIESFFSEGTRYYATDVDSALLNVLKSCTESKKENNYIGAKYTVGVFVDLARVGALKDFHIGNEPFIEAVYPFLWKDILVEQGKLSWNCKSKNGIAKWPLKKFLEEYMAHEFIYRRKTGFGGRFFEYLHQKDVYALTRDTLLSPTALISDVISREKVRELVDDLPTCRFISNQTENFLWGALFTELWLQENYKPALRNKKV